MTKNLAAALAALWMILPVAPGALAQKGGGPLESRLVAHKVVVAEGRETLTPATDAMPGDVIEYVATYNNVGRDTITGLQATLPIPPETEFIPGSTRPAGALASVDGRSFAGIPLKRTVERAGRTVDLQVPYREYRYLRWSAGEVDGGKVVEFRARVRVIDDSPAREPNKDGSGK